MVGQATRPSDDCLLSHTHGRTAQLIDPAGARAAGLMNHSDTLHPSREDLMVWQLKPLPTHPGP